MASGLDDGDHPFSAAVSVHAAEHGDVTFAHPFESANGLFQLDRIDIPSPADDEVFFPAGDEQLACGDVAAVAGLEPPVADQGSGGFRIFEIALRGRRAAELQATLVTLRQLASAFVDDPKLVLR